MPKKYWVAPGLRSSVSGKCWCSNVQPLYQRGSQRGTNFQADNYSITICRAVLLLARKASYVLQECVVTSTRVNAGLTCYLFCTETNSERSATSHRTVQCCALTVRGRYSRCFCFPPIVEDQIDFQTSGRFASRHLVVYNQNPMARREHGSSAKKESVSFLTQVWLNSLSYAFRVTFILCERLLTVDKTGSCGVLDVVGSHNPAAGYRTR